MTRKQTIIVAMTLCMAPSGAAFCQDIDPGVVQQRAVVVRASDGMDGNTEVMAFEMSDNDSSMFFADSFDGAFDFSMGAPGNSFSMLNNPSVQKDLQLVDEQLNQIKEINKEFGEKIKEQMETMKDENGNFNFNTGADFGQLIGDLRQQQQDQISSILLPNQQKRLQQVSRQMSMQRRGTSKALTGKLAEELGITAEQRKRIQAKSKELKKDLEEKIAELKANAKKQLLNELTAGQKEKLKELLGDEFVQKKEDRASRFRMMHSGSNSAKSGDF